MVGLEWTKCALVDPVRGTVIAMPPGISWTFDDEYVFVIRKRIGEYFRKLAGERTDVRKDRHTAELTTFIDINSPGLRDLLRRILKDVRGIDLREDKLSVGLQKQKVFSADMD